MQWSSRSRFSFLLLLLLLECGCFFFSFRTLLHSSKSFPWFVVMLGLGYFHNYTYFFSAPHTCAGTVRTKEKTWIGRMEEKQIRFSASVFSSFQVSSSTIYFFCCTQFLLACTVATNNWFELSLIRVKWLKQVFLLRPLTFVLSLFSVEIVANTRFFVSLTKFNVFLICFCLSLT